MYNLILAQENINGQLISSNVLHFDGEGNPLKKYNTGLSQFDDLKIKKDWLIKEYSESDKVKLYDTYRPNANVSYMDKVSGFVRIYKNPSDNILIIQNGLGLSSSIQSFAIKTK